MPYQSARSLSELGRRPPPKLPAERHWTPTPRPTWGPAAQLSPRLRMQASAGFRAAAIPLGPGLYLVAEVPEESTRTEFGLAPLLVPLMLMAAKRALNEAAPAQGRAPVQPTTVQPVAPPPRGAPEVASWMARLAQFAQPQTYQPTANPAVQLGWVHPHDAAQIGCASCRRSR